MEGKKTALIIICIYCLLSLAMTWPLAVNFSDSIDAGGDTLAYIWGFWWVKNALIEIGTTPYYTPFLFYPNGVSLAYGGPTMYNSLLAIPLQDIFGVFATYNLLSLSSIVLSALGAYL